MLNRLKIHHFGTIIETKNKLKVENFTKKKFQIDPIQGTKILFTKPLGCKFYIEYILKMGRVKNAKVGYHHVCYNINNLKDIKKILKNFNNVIELTEVEKSGSKECNYIQFYYFPKIGIVEFNIKNV